MQSSKWFSGLGTAARGLAAGLSSARPAASVAGFHTTAACLKQKFVGTVVSNSMNKSVVVAVERLWIHPKYKKAVKKRSKIMSHAEYDEYEPGDKVLIEQCRPISKQKAFMVIGHTSEEKEAELKVLRANIQAERDAKRAATQAYWAEKKLEYDAAMAKAGTA